MKKGASSESSLNLAAKFLCFEAATFMWWSELMVAPSSAEDSRSLLQGLLWADVEIDAVGVDLWDNLTKDSCNLGKPVHVPIEDLLQGLVVSPTRLVLLIIVFDELEIPPERFQDSAPEIHFSIEEGHPDSVVHEDVSPPVLQAEEIGMTCDSVATIQDLVLIVTNEGHVLRQSPSDLGVPSLVV